MRRSAVVLAMATLSLCLASLALAQPVIPNAGLEAGKTTPDQWTTRTGDNGQGQFSWETKIVHSGQHALQVKKIGVAGYTAIDSPFITVKPGQTYLITAWVYPLQRVRRGVYFMITQSKPDSDAEQLPNTFGSTNQPLVQDTWQQVKVRVTIRPGNTRLRIHCIQGFAPSQIVWDDFAITTGQAVPPPRYVKPVNEPLPPLGPAEAIMAKRPWATARVEMRGARPRLIVDGKSIPWAFHVTWDGPNLAGAHIGDFARAGVHVHLVPLVLGNGLYGRRGPWLGKNKYDFSVVDQMLWRVLRVDPHGYVIFYMCCDPYPAWGAENPNDVTEDQNGKKAIVWMHPIRWGGAPPGKNERYGPCLVSQKLRADISETLRRLVAHVESTEAGKAVIGYHVAGFNDGQWFQWASFAPNNLHLADYCPAAEAAFRQWLRRRYGGQVEALRQAWHNPTVTFETAQIPPGDRWYAKNVFINPSTQQDIADYTRFYSEGVEETVSLLAGVLKQATPRPIICGTYYEDITGASPDHIALAQYLAGKNIDYLAGPAAYGIRMPGYQSAVRNVFGSTLLHGKTYLTEQDWRSWLSVPNTPQNNFSWGRAETVAAHNAMVRRDCGMMLAFGLGTWWYDMGGGWFANKGIMSGIAEAVRAFKDELVDTDSPRGDVAVFVSELSDSYISPRFGGQYRLNGIRNQIEEINTAGVPYRLYLQSDLGKLKLPEARAYVFLNPYVLTDVQKRAIAGLKRDGQLLAFVQAPGYVGTKDPAAAISALTGLKVQARGNRPGQSVAPESGSSPLLANLAGQIGLAGSPPGPYFAVTDPRATPLATYTGTQDVAIAARDFGTWKSVFIGCPGFTDAFFHNLAQWAGAWTVAPAGDAVYASQHFLTIHAIFPGHKVMHLARPSKVIDLTSGKVIAQKTDTVTVDMKRGETRWFRLE